jgi:hypothetical protein
MINGAYSSVRIEITKWVTRRLIEEDTMMIAFTSDSSPLVKSISTYLPCTCVWGSWHA